MKSFLRLCLLLLLVTGGQAARAESGKPIYRIYGIEVPPLIFSTANGTSGFVTDITVEAFRRAGYSVSVEIVPWSRAISETRDQKVDGLIPAIRSPERELILAFTQEPVFLSEQSLFHSPQRPITWNGKVDELGPYRCIKLLDALISPEFDAAIKDGKIHCEQTTSYDSVMLMLAHNRAAFAVAPKLIGLHSIRKEALQDKLLPLQPPLVIQPFFIAFSKNPALAAVREQVNVKLAEMRKDGSMKAIIENYQKSTVPTR